MAGGRDPRRAFGEIQLWDAAAGTLRRSVMLDRRYGFSAPRLSPDGTRVAAGCTDNTVRILDTGQRQGAQQNGVRTRNWVLATLFGADGKAPWFRLGATRAAGNSPTPGRAQFLENVNLLRGELAAIARHPSKGRRGHRRGGSRFLMSI